MKSCNLTMKEFWNLSLVLKEEEWPRVKRKEASCSPMNDEAWPSIQEIDNERDSTHPLQYA